MDGGFPVDDARVGKPPEGVGSVRGRDVVIADVADVGQEQLQGFGKSNVQQDGGVLGYLVAVIAQLFGRAEQNYRPAGDARGGAAVLHRAHQCGCRMGLKGEAHPVVDVLQVIVGLAALDGVVVFDAEPLGHTEVVGVGLFQVFGEGEDAVFVHSGVLRCGAGAPA